MVEESYKTNPAAREISNVERYRWPDIARKGHDM
jgi:hypothetical protein